MPLIRQVTLHVLCELFYFEVNFIISIHTSYTDVGTYYYMQADEATSKRPKVGELHNKDL